MLGDRETTQMNLRRKRVILALVILTQAAALLMLAEPMAPVKKGTSAEFWRFACGVDLDGQGSDLMGRVYQPRDGWYVYSIVGFEGDLPFRVSRSEAIADYPQVLRSIAAAGDSPDMTPGALRAYRVALRAYRVLEEDEAAVRENPEEFLTRMEEAWLSELRQEDEDRYTFALAGEKVFAGRWACMRRYWLNLLLEFVYFACLTLFAFWPWLNRKGRLAWCIHVGLLPLLLFAPCYFGYASWTATFEEATGGVLYPWVIIWFRALSPLTRVDIWIIERIPQILEPISQPLLPWRLFNEAGAFGPVGAVTLGLMLSGLTWWMFRIRDRRRSFGGGKEDGGKQTGQVRLSEDRRGREL